VIVMCRTRCFAQWIWLPVALALVLGAGQRAAVQAAESGWKASPARVEARSKRPGEIYDEAKVPKYKLPDPLVMLDGTKVTDAATWRTKRRPEILELFRTQVYGKSPARPEKVASKVFDLDRKALDGLATRMQVSVSLGGRQGAATMDILLYVPNAARKPVPAFVGLNFAGNQAIHADPAIKLSASWMRNRGRGVVKNRATEESRGASRSRWPVEMILKRGYALATIYYGDIDPDFHDGFKNGVHAAHDRFDEGKRPPDAWGSISAWAWGLSRAMDYFETNDAVDHKRVAVLGHSRLGKTALWAGAQDKRFALTISNNSGCGGAALSSRRYGESVKRINTSFPHWFCDNFKTYNDREGDLPVDQHMLVAQIAPRAANVASADEDLWADPRGEFLSCKHADPVYRLLGVEGLGVEAMPPLDRPVAKGRIGYHVRSGGHDVKTFDWQQYLDFADKHLGAK
jgi:hypothetical protein